MKLRNRWTFTIPALALAFFAGACTPKPFLKVQYQMPLPTSALEGKKVALAVSDLRAKKTVLSENARMSLNNFDETFSLVVLREDGSGNLIGVYDLVSLFTEVFQQRLQNEGVRVATVADHSAPELKIEIFEFQLDFAERKWIVRMNYRANLSSNGSLLSKESVSGEAERLKVTGKSDAEKVLGELLTDMVNRLNLVNLFQQARQ